MPVPIEKFLPIQRTHTLAETWRAWKEGELIVAFLGDGSKISAVGRPHGSVCEVHSERGTENRTSSECLFWRPCDVNGKWEIGSSI